MHSMHFTYVCMFLFKSKKKISVCRELVFLVEMDIACNNALDQLRCCCDLAFSFFIFFFFLKWSFWNERSKDKDGTIFFLFFDQTNRTNWQMPYKILWILTWIFQYRIFTRFFSILVVVFVVNKCRLCEQNMRTLWIWLFLFSFSIRHKRR